MHWSSVAIVLVNSLVVRALSSCGLRCSKVLLLICLFGILITPSADGQNRNLRKQGESFYRAGQYHEACKQLKEYCTTKPKDLDAWLWWADCQYQTNDLDGALRSLSHIQKESKKTGGPVLLQYSRTYHQIGDFKSAAKYYKQYLSLEESENAGEVINEIKRCAVGMRYSFHSDDVLIENMGAEVNSQYDDFGPVESPNFDSRVYFSSIRAKRITDQFSQSGKYQKRLHTIDCDMYATEIVNGAWSEVTPLNPDLNTDKNEVLQDFSDDGMTLFFTRGSRLSDSHFFVDTFDVDARDPKGVACQDLPFSPSEDIRGIYFFSDSSFIFSSNRSGGMGGFDLYFCKKEKEGWGKSHNLGDKINTPYDEVTPFLCKNGRTLYFSSNSLSSMGGFDIFYSTFDDNRIEWESPQNLGQPQNSPGNDLFYRVAASGFRAYFSSDRKSGHGGHDIYSAYFHRPLQTNLTTSVPSLFSEVRNFRLFSENMVDPSTHKGGVTSSGSLFEVPYLLYRDDQIITPQNKAKMDKLVGFLKTYPHVNIEIISHSDMTAVSNFDLFFAINRAEQVAEYFEKRGIRSGALFMKGTGGNYPIALNEIEGKENETGRFYNRRIDFRIHQTGQLPIELKFDFPELTEAMKDERLTSFLDKTNGLSYRVEFAELDQLYKGDLIGKYADGIIEKRAIDAKYRYCSGHFKTFNKALNHLTRIKSEGFSDARIIAYINGLRLQGSSIDTEVLEDFPDIKNFVLYLQ